MIAIGLALLAIVFGLAGTAGVIARHKQVSLTGVSGFMFFLALLCIEIAA